MSARRIAVVSAGLSESSSTRLLADRLAAATARELGGAEIAVVELREHAHDLMDNLLTGFPSPSLKSAIDTVVGADALIVVTPVFNSSYSGLFKTFFDVLESGALDGMPLAIGATGGTARHSLVIEHSLRPLFAYLRAAAVPTGVYAATVDWGDAESGLPDRIDRAAGELSDALSGRARRGPADPFENPVPFAELLAR